jgi:hypothetical protein
LYKRSLESGMMAIMLAWSSACGDMTCRTFDEAPID